MFTGIIEFTGLIVDIDKQSQQLMLRVDIGELVEKKPALGDSIAVNGVCLTVASMQGTLMDFYVSNETIEKTLIKNYEKGQKVNLETALTLSTPLGGHIVSGHVDGLCELISRNPSGDGFVYGFKVNQSLGRYVASKGSVALDGISLTSNSVRDESGHTYFEVALVPHTIENTNLKFLKEGDQLHFEIDMLARYMQRMLEVTQ